MSSQTKRLVYLEYGSNSSVGTSTICTTRPTEIILVLKYAEGIMENTITLKGTENVIDKNELRRLRK
jgi:hypothetical protein